MCSQARIWDNWPQPPTWLNMRRHGPPPKDAKWDDVVKSTTGHMQARYKRGAPREQLEIQCFNQGIADPERFECTKRGNEQTAVFWMDCGVEIGASNGSKTSYIVVKFQLQGTVTTLHGYPITALELRDEYGVDL